MVNQWGRNSGGVQARPSGPGGGFLLAAALLVVILGGIGYGWYTREGLNGRIAALTAERDDARERLVEAAKAHQDLEARLGDLKRNAGDWAEQLEKDYAELKLNELPKLTRLLDKRDADLDALQKEKAAVEARAAKEADAARRAEAALKAEVAKGDAARREADTAREGEAKAYAAETTQLRDRLAAAESALAALRAGQDRAADAAGAESRQQIDALRQRVRALEAELAQARQAAQADDAVTDAKAEEERDALRAERDAARAAAAEAGEALTAERSARRGVEAERDALLRAADTAPAGTTEAPAGTTQAPAGTDEAPAADRAATPRDPARVDAVLSQTPGMSGLAAADRLRLRDRLIEGACVTQALESVYDRVPIIVMRNLIRGLESGC
ncbi:coiled-coil domain-containing protein [Ensifer soli]|uniref:hypothetical protein n=1 Tax=Ciceribacter sp. sgz301302 TaxID=3342379 RepID=UPI0035B8B8AB